MKYLKLYEEIDFFSTFTDVDEEEYEYGYDIDLLKKHAPFLYDFLKSKDLVELYIDDVSNIDDITFEQYIKDMKSYKMILISYMMNRNDKHNDIWWKIDQKWKDYLFNNYMTK